MNTNGDAVDPQPYLTLADGRRVSSLLEECGELWDDPPSWQQHVANGMEEIVGGFCGVLILSDRTLASPSISVMAIARSIEANMRALLGTFRSDGGEVLVPGATGLRPLLKQRGSFAGTLAELSSECTYRSSEFFQRFMRPLNAHSTLCSIAVTRTALHASPNLTLARERQDRPFSERDRNVLLAIAEGLAPRVSHKLAVHGQRGRHELTPRQRDVLGGLLQGDSEKQIAARLALSQPTVHDHVTALYRHFGACSRGELLVYFLRRRPTISGFRGCGA